MDSIGSMLLAILQYLAEDLPIGRAEDVVEIAASVLRGAASVRAAERGDGPAAAEKIAQGIGSLGRLGERADKHQVDVVGKDLHQVFKPGIADKLDIMAFLP